MQNKKISDNSDTIICYSPNSADKIITNCTNITSDISALSKYSISEAWHIFYVETNPSYSNKEQIYSAGYLEGYIYTNYINYHYTNIKKTVFNNDMDFSKDALSYITRQKDFINFLSENPSNDYEELLTYFIEQLKGMYDGYKEGYNKNGDKTFPLLSEDEFYYLSYFGDLSDISLAYPKNIENNNNKLHECTIYVKYFKETNDIYFAHNTHNIYSMMNRIYKHYNIKIITNNGKKINEIKFTSRPGDLNSKDDFYITSNKLVIGETSLYVYNKDMYKFLSEKTVPKFLRTMIANALAENANDWIKYFIKYNSGTHNNQWIIFDYKELSKIGKNNNEKINLCYMIEQTPNINKIVFKNMTENFLNDGYIASYNAPLFEETIKNLGTSTENDYYHAKRYLIIKNLDKNINNLDDVKYLIGYHDKDNLCDQIGARCDIGSDNPFGAIDGKIVNNELLENMKAYIKYGPPFIEGVSEPFQFSGRFKDFCHYGITEEVMDFDWIIK